MPINLSELLSKEGTSKTFDAVFGMSVFKTSFGEYPVIAAKPLKIEVCNAGKRKASIHTEGIVTLAIPCDRCLEDVETDIEFTVDRTIAMDTSDSDGNSDRIEVDEQDFMDGTMLDVDKLVYPEVLINLPAKILCKPDCLGLCPVCGVNLNQGECGCDRSSPDPRMSVIQDIFNNRKEV